MSSINVRESVNLPCPKNRGIVGPSRSGQNVDAHVFGNSSGFGSSECWWDRTER